MDIIPFKNRARHRERRLKDWHFENREHPDYNVWTDLNETESIRVGEAWRIPLLTYNENKIKVRLYSQPLNSQQWNGTLELIEITKKAEPAETEEEPSSHHFFRVGFSRRQQPAIYALRWVYHFIFNTQTTVLLAWVIFGIVIGMSVAPLVHYGTEYATTPVNGVPEATGIVETLNK